MIVLLFLFDITVLGRTPLNATVDGIEHSLDNNANSSVNFEEDYSAEYFKNRILNDGFADEHELRRALERSIQACDTKNILYVTKTYSNNLQK